MGGTIEVKGSVVSDSRGIPTVRVELSYEGQTVATMVPSGKSAGSREAHELRDDDGKGVLRAVENVNTVIAPVLRDMPPDPFLIDKKLLELDGTKDKTHLGANALLGVSMAAFCLAARVENIPLWKHVANLTDTQPSFPHLYMNMLNGGAHASFRLPFQEYIVVVGGRGARESYAEANAIFETLGTLIHERYGDVPMGDEGGYSPHLNDIEKPFEILQDATGGESGVFLAIDAAASEFYHDGKYILGGLPYEANDLLNLYKNLSHKFNLKSIEDPFDESDYSSFEMLMRDVGERILIVGDDLTVTNPELVRAMAEAKRANAMIVKPNQIGTISEVLETVRIAKDAGWKLIVSHRSGETVDTFISDFAVGIGAYGLKAGAPTQEERRVKYERLIEIEEEMSKIS